MGAQIYDEGELDNLRAAWVRSRMDLRESIEALEAKQQWIDYFFQERNTVALRRESIALTTIIERHTELLRQERTAWKAYEDYARAFYHHTKDFPLPPVIGEIKDI